MRAREKKAFPAKHSFVVNRLEPREASVPKNQWPQWPVESWSSTDKDDSLLYDLKGELTEKEREVHLEPPMDENDSFADVVLGQIYQKPR